MNDGDFIATMCRTAAEIGKEPTDETYAAFRDRFIDWPAESFAAAMTACGAELEWFPSVSQVLARDPRKSYKTGQLELVKASERAVALEHQNAGGVATDVETRIDALTDPELREVFNAAGCWDGVEFTIKMFRKNKQGIYRGIVRDQLKKQG